jgi:hypothetical protein
MTRRCFISAKYGVELGTLQRVLDDVNVEWAWAHTSPHGSTVVEAVSQAIKRADFVVGVITDDDINANVMLEVGIAILRFPYCFSRPGRSQFRLTWHRFAISTPTSTTPNYYLYNSICSFVALPRRKAISAAQ